MKIVVLDGYTLNPGDLDWARLRGLGDCEIHDRTHPDEIVARARDADVILTNKCPLSADTLPKLPRLRYIGVLATGYNIVDIDAAAAAKIVVTNVPAYGTRAVAQHVFALLLELTNSVGVHARSVREGEWARSVEWCYWKRPLVELDGLALGLVGYGRIGCAVAEIGRALGMRIVVASRRAPAEAGIAHVGLDDLFRLSDVVSLHCPLTPDTRGMVSRARLELMKRSAFLINTARGPLINEADLAAALHAGSLAGAALDVLSTEPPSAENPLAAAPNCVITPHIAWAAVAARSRLMEIAVANLEAWQHGSPQNRVN